MKLVLIMASHWGDLSVLLQHICDRDTGLAATVYFPAGLAPQLNADIVALPYTTDNPDWQFDPQSHSSAVIVLDPRLSPIPQLDRIATACATAAMVPAKTIALVDCKAAATSSQLRGYMEACIFHADVVVLGNRSDAGKKFVRDYQKGYEQQCCPSRFLMLHPVGIAELIAELFSPDVRRLSQLFDLDPQAVDSVPGLIIEASCDLDLDEVHTDPYRNGADGNPPALSVPDISVWIQHAAP